MDIKTGLRCQGCRELGRLGCWHLLTFESPTRKLQLLLILLIALDYVHSLLIEIYCTLR